MLGSIPCLKHIGQSTKVAQATTALFSFLTTPSPKKAVLARLQTNLGFTQVNGCLYFY